MSANTSPSQDSFVRSNQRHQQINLTYRSLIDFHIGNLRVESDRKKTSSNSINNHMTAINKWLEFATWMNGVLCTHSQRPRLSPSDLVGTELDEDFDRQLLAHLTVLEKEKLASATINNRKSLLMKWHESYILLMKTAGLPEKFSEALDFLLEKRGGIASPVARSCNTTVSTLLRWKNGKSMPGAASRRYVVALESYFGLPPGTLLIKTLLSVSGSTENTEGNKSTPHRRYVSEIRKKPYKLGFDLFTDKQQQEWKDLFRNSLINSI